MPGSSLAETLHARLARQPVTGAVRHVPMDAYHAAVDEYVARATVGRTVRSIYRIGSVSVPGLSDIDLIVVMRDRSRAAAGRYGISHLGPLARYAFSHDPIFTDADLFTALPLWFPASSAEYIWGDELTIDSRWASDTVVKTIHVVQMLLCYQIQLLRMFAFGPALDERVSENLVKGLCNTIALWESVAPSSGQSPWAKFAADYLAFRRGWFEGDQQARLDEFLRFVSLSIVRTAQLIETVGSHLSAVWFEEEPLTADASIWLGRDRVRFVSRWSPDDAMLDACAGGPLQFPLVYGAFMRGYRGGRGLVARHVRRLFPDGADVRFRDDSIQQTVARHRQVLESLADFHADKFRMSPNPFITFWAPYTTSRVIRACDRLCDRVMNATAFRALQEN